MRSLGRFIAIFGIVFAGIFTPAQTQPNLDNGFKPYGSYGGGGLDSVNLQNGNLILHIPMPFSYPQRGNRLAPKNVLRLTSKSWAVVTLPNGNGGVQEFWSLGFGPAANLAQLGTGIGLDHTLDLSLHRLLQSETGGGFSSFGHYITTWDGGLHQLHSPANAPLDANGTPTSYDAIDGSGYHVDLANPNSQTGIPNSGVIIDRAGNRYQIAGWATYCSKPVTSGFTSLPSLPGESQGSQQLESEMDATYAAVTGISDPYGDFKRTVLQDASFSGSVGSTSITTCQQASRTATITDVNGNVLNSFFSSTSGDTMGRPLEGVSGATQTTDYTGCISPSASIPISSAAIYTYLGVGGAGNQVKLCFGNFPIQTNFGVVGITEYQNETSAQNNGVLSAPLIVTVILSDAPNWGGTRWTFNYDGYFNPTDIGLPSGGSIHYDWTKIAQPNCGTVTPVSRAVAARTVNDNNGNSSKWTYQWGTSSGGSITNKVTDPLNNDSVHVFTTVDGANGCVFYETSTRQYQGSSTAGTLLKQVDTTYSSPTAFNDPLGANGGLGNIVPVSIRTTLTPNGSNKVSLVTRSYDQGPGNGRPIFGSITAEKVYDWGVGAPGPLLRETDTTYQWQVDSSGNYLNTHDVDAPASVVVKDASGNRLAETDYVYDETAYLTPSGITSQHTSPPGPVRANPSTVSRWLNTSASPVVGHTNWYDTGEVYQAIDPLGHITTYSYDPFYAGAYSTKTCNALSQCVSGTYDFTTGLLTSFTDANAGTNGQASGNTQGNPAHTSNYSYDVMSRMTVAQAPPDPASNRPQTSFTYSAPNVFPLNVQRSHTITTSLNDVSTSYFDGLGRGYETVHATPNGNATVMTTYDGLGNPVSVTNPYFSTSDPTYGVIQTQFDALGRPTQVTKQDGSVSSVAYNYVPIQAAAGDCTKSADEAGKQRLTCADSLGRLIEVHEPGDSFNGSQAQGSLNIAGSLQTYTIPGTNATHATGSVTIGGAEQWQSGGRYCAAYDENGDCVDWEVNPPTYDAGTVTITVNGHSDTYSYGQGDSAYSIATGLAGIINNDAGAFVTASASGGTVSLTSKATGSAANYSLSSSYAYDNLDFTGPSFTTSNSGAAMTGGTNGTSPTTIYDSGTVTVTIGSFIASAPYSQSGNSTAALVASALAGSGSTGLSRSGSPVTASASGSTITIHYATVGTAGDISVGCSSATGQGTYFSGPSFTCPATTAMSGGYNAEGASLDFNYFVTQYNYDAIGNLLKVTQEGDPTVTSSSQYRVRTFTYDSLSRLLTANNPESGTISYSYDANSNLLQKTSPAPNQTGTATQTISYCYETLDRVSAKAYSAQSCPLSSPAVTYTYDVGTNGIGHLTSLTDQAGSASYIYDGLGRTVGESRTVAGTQKTLAYTYNLDNSMATLTYPSGAVVTYTPDAAGRIVSAADSGNNINYVTSATYGADNGLTGFISGNSSSFAGISNSFSYNKRLQPVNMSATSPNATVFSIGYDFHLGNGDNGNVYGITNYRDTSRNQTFTYDALNRLTSAQNAGIDCTKQTVNNLTEYWGSSYGYNAWGNLLQKTITKCGAESLSVSALANNQLVGYSYDAAGNMTHDATTGNNYSYDQENRITGAAGYTYTYDADGNRVEKSNGSAGTIYWYMSPGIVAESDLAGALKSEYVFFDGERVARKDFPGNSVFYYFSDQLKTASVITDSAGTIKEDEDYYPWGGELQFVNNDSNRYKFTGKERDSETQLDYFGARYYGNWVGRFITPDKPFADQHASDPQSWNLYSYARNNPLTFLDDTGRGTRPAKSPRVNDALAQDPTLRAVILAANNFSPGSFEDALNSGALSDLNFGEGAKLRGLAAEADVLDRLNYNMENAHSAYPQPTSLTGVHPDVGVFIDNDFGITPTQLQNVATFSVPLGLGNDVAIPPGTALAFMEVKSGLSPSGIRDGVTQTVNTAVAIDKVNPGVAISVLVVDATAWAKLKPEDRNNYIAQTTAAGAYIQVQPGLNRDATERAQDLINRASPNKKKDNGQQ